MSRVICSKRNLRHILSAALLFVVSPFLRSDMSSTSPHGPCGSGQSPACTKAGVYPCEHGGVFLCDDCAQLNPTAAALRKLATERDLQFQVAKGGTGGLAYGSTTDAIGGNQSGEPASRVRPVILTLLDARSVVSIPKDYADNYDFSKVSSGFPGMTAILGTISYTVLDLDAGVHEKLISTFALSFSEEEVESGKGLLGFPAATAIPIGLFLSPTAGHDSAPALLETIFGSLARSWQGKAVGLSKAFQIRLQDLVTAETTDVDSNAPDPVKAPASRVTRTKADAVAPIGSLSLRLRLFFEMVAEGLYNTWSLSEVPDEPHVLPYPRLSAALGPHCSWENMDDFTMTFNLPVQPHTVRRFFNTCGMLESALELLGAPAIPDGEFAGKDFAFIVRVFQRRIHGGVKPSPNKRPNNSRSGLPSGTVDGSMPPPSPRLGLGMASPYSSSGMSPFRGFDGGSGGSSSHQLPGSSVSPAGSTSIDIGQGLITDPNETRRLQIEAMGRNTAEGVPNRAEAFAMQAALQSGTTDSIQGLASRLQREQAQTRCGLGLKADGSGPMRFHDAPPAVRIAVLMGRGDERVKVGTAGVAVAPNVHASMAASLQTGARGQGVSVTLSEAGFIITQQYHKLSVLSLAVTITIDCVIGSEEKPKSKVKPEDDDSIPGGEDIINFLENVVLCRGFFDAGSEHTNDLRIVLENVKMARRQNYRVAHVWRALRSLFQSFHQQLQQFAISHVVMAEPRLIHSYVASDLLWERARSRAVMADSVDPAWRQSALDKKVPDRGPGGGGANTNTPQPQSKVSFLNSVPADQRKAVALILKGGNPRDAGRDGKNGRNGKNGKNGKNDRNDRNRNGTKSAKGDDIRKAKGSPMWPDHLDTVCKWFQQGRDCHAGKDCDKYCYYTKDAAQYKKA